MYVMVSRDRVPPLLLAPAAHGRRQRPGTTTLSCDRDAAGDGRRADARGCRCGRGRSDDDGDGILEGVLTPHNDDDGNVRLTPIGKVIGLEQILKLRFRLTDVFAFSRGLDLNAQQFTKRCPAARIAQFD